METSGVVFGAGVAAVRRADATGRFGTTDSLGAACGLGAGDRFGAAARLGAARCFRAAAGRTRAADRRGAIAGFDTLGAGVRRFGDGRFGDLRRDAVATFAPAPVFRGAADFRARSGKAALAALAFFLACLAAFLLAFATFRACLSAFLAARTRRFAASACATALLASDSSRCAAAAWVARDESDLDVATSYSLR